MGYTIDGLTPADWVRRKNDHNLHKHQPWTCSTCFADESLHVAMWEGVPKHTTDGSTDDADTCETCWLATK